MLKNVNKIVLISFVVLTISTAIIGFGGILGIISNRFVALFWLFLMLFVTTLLYEGDIRES